MKAMTFLIAYQPYPNRDERCTIGALVFDENGKMKTHLVGNLRKLRALDPGCDLEQIRDSLRDFSEYCNETPNAWAALQSGVGSFRFSEKPGYFLYQNANDYDTQVKNLLLMMAEPRRAEQLKDRSQKSRLYLDLKRTFSQYGWLAKSVDEINQHKVVTQYPVSMQDHLFAEFAMKNGRLHVVETIDFRTGVPSAKRLEAQGKALVLDFARDLDKETICTAIVAASDYNDIKPSVNVLRKYADRVISFESSSEMNSFFKDWSSHMGRPMLPIPEMR